MSSSAQKRSRDGRSVVPATANGLPDPSGRAKLSNTDISMIRTHFPPEPHRLSTLGTPSATQGDLQTVTGAHVLPTLTETTQERCSELGNALRGVAATGTAPTPRQSAPYPFSTAPYLPKQGAPRQIDLYTTSEILDFSKILYCYDKQSL